MRGLVAAHGRAPFDVSGTAHLTARAQATPCWPGCWPARRPAGRGDHLDAAGRLAAAWGRAAVDGDPATTWTDGLRDGGGRLVDRQPGDPLTVDHLDLAVVDDGRPLGADQPRLRDEAGGSGSWSCQPWGTDGARRVPLGRSGWPFRPLTATRSTVTVAAIDPRTTVDRRSGESVVLPVAVAELGLPARRPAAARARSTAAAATTSSASTAHRGRAAPRRDRRPARSPAPHHRARAGGATLALGEDAPAPHAAVVTG